MNTSQNIAGNTNVLAAALHSANLLAIEKASVQAPMIVVRQDLLGNRYVFLVDTHDRVNNTIKFWDGKKGSKPADAPIQFYKGTTPIENEEIRKKLIQDFSKEFGHKEIVVRQRLVKFSAAMERDEQGQAATVDVNDFKTRLLAAITKAINETL